MIDLIVPTRNRYDKLMKMLSTVPEVDWLRVIIVVDGDMRTYENIIGKNNWTTLYRKGHNGSVACRNLACSFCTGSILYATDDIIFKEGAIEDAKKALEENFEDLDGVIGFRQAAADFHPTGVALVGRKFFERYPEKKLFCPEYFHFSCQEVYRLAKKLDKFYAMPEVGVIHEHFGIYQQDSTAREARKYKKKDFDINRRRRTEGITWGDE